MEGGREALYGRHETEYLNGSYVHVAQVDEEIKQWHGC